MIGHFARGFGHACAEFCKRLHGLGVDIVKGNKVFVFIGLFCRNLAKNNLAENTV